MTTARVTAVCASALALAGWQGLALLGERLLPGPGWLAALLLAWLLVLRTAAIRVEALAAPGATVLACVAAGAVWCCVRGGGAAMLVIAAVAWAALVATLAARSARTLAPAEGLVCAAVGAALAWAVLGDPSDPMAMSLRCAALLAVAGTVAPIGMAGRRRVALPCADGAVAWLMIPLMAGLAPALAVCSSAGASPRTVLAAHLGLMLLPSIRSRWIAAGRTAPARCPDGARLAGGLRPP